MSGQVGGSGRASHARKRGDGGDGLAPRASLSEWIVAGVSALLVLAMLAFTVAEALRGPEGPAVVTVSADSVVSGEAGHIVLFTLRNAGGETAANVHVYGEIRAGGASVEESEVVLDYVPAGARRRGALQFRTDPSEHELEVRVTGFASP